MQAVTQSSSPTEAMNRGRALIAEHAKTADVVITTAQVPGRRAPLLITEEAVDGMKRGSIVIDLAGSTGGNCALSQADVTVERDGVTIIAPTNLSATVPVHASQLYSRNVTSFLSLLIKDGQLQIDMKDDVVGPSCVTHNGEVVNQRVAARCRRNQVRRVIEMSVRNFNLRALRVCARGVSWLPGDLASAAAVAHASDVCDQCDLRHFARRIDRYCGGALQHRQHDSRFHCCRLLDHERRGRFRDHRSHVEDVQTERDLPKRIKPQIFAA